MHVGASFLLMLRLEGRFKGTLLPVILSGRLACWEEIPPLALKADSCLLLYLLRALWLLQLDT